MLFDKYVLTVYQTGKGINCVEYARTLAAEVCAVAGHVGKWSTCERCLFDRKCPACDGKGIHYVLQEGTRRNNGSCQECDGTGWIKEHASSK